MSRSPKASPKASPKSAKARKKERLSTSSLQQIQLLPNEFLVQIKQAKPNSRNHPHRCYMNVKDMELQSLRIGDFVMLGFVLEGVPTKIFGICWPMATLDEQTCMISSSIIDGIVPNSIFIERPDFSLRDALEVEIDYLAVDSDFQEYLREFLIDYEYLAIGESIKVEYLLSTVFVKVTAINRIENDPLLIARYIKSTKLSRRKDSKPAVTNIIPKLDQIGGLEKELAEIKELANLTFFKTARFTGFGLPPPKGFLLYGVPGTGKTKLVGALASELQVSIISCVGSDVKSVIMGQAEEKLKNLFQQANDSAPCILFIDEIDSLARQRDSASCSDVDKRVVACLLTLMDQCKDILVVGATNRIDDIDGALRRPGRFDKEFEIGVPSPIERLAILNIYLDKIEHHLTLENIKSIADRAHGYVGADLEAVVGEAMLFAISKSSNQIETPALIDFDDMEKALGMVKPSVTREVVLQVPNVRWNDIGGQEDTKSRLKEAVEWPLKHPELFQRFNIRPPKGVLLYGPPGCSKTLMAKALATESGLNFFAVKGPELFSKWVGESEKAIQQVFRKARLASPSVIFFDEIDALATKRSGAGDTSVGGRVLSQLLSEMDGVEALVNVTVVAATNRPDLLDSALLRPGRIDACLYVSPPDYDSRLKIFEIEFRKTPIAADVDPRKLAALTDGFSGAEVVAVVRNGSMKALEEDFDALQVEMKYFVMAVVGTKKRITPEVVEFYREFESRTGLDVL